MKRPLKTTAWTILGIVLVCTLVMYYLPGHRSLRYVLWKNGWHPFPGVRVIYDAVKVDKDRDQLVKGLRIEELRKRFPDAHEKPATPGQEYWSEQKASVEHLWLGDTEMVIILEGGIGKSIDLWKG